MLALSRNPGESIHIGDDITVTVVRVRGQKVKLGIEAPKSLKVLRNELYEQEKAAKGGAA